MLQSGGITKKKELTQSHGQRRAFPPREPPQYCDLQLAQLNSQYCVDLRSRFSQATASFLRGATAILRPYIWARQ